MDIPGGASARRKVRQSFCLLGESLKIAEKSGCPVVPVAITGTAILEKHFPFIRPSHVTIEFGEAFYIKELPAEDRKRADAYSEARIKCW